MEKKTVFKIRRRLMLWRLKATDTILKCVDKREWTMDEQREELEVEILN